MKLPFLGLALLCPTLALASGEIPADTILVNVGKKASVWFYGEKKADLKTLEGYDWNAILRDMNAKLGLTTPAESRQNYVDLLGNSYLQDSTLRKGGSVVKVAEREADKPISAKEAWRNLSSGTQVGISFGLLTCSAWNGYATDFDFLPFNSNYFSVSLLRNTVLKQRKSSFSLRWGVELSRMQFRQAGHSEINPSSYVFPYAYPGLERYNEGERYGSGISYVIKSPSGYPGQGMSVLEERFDRRKYVATYLNLPLMPTWTFYNQQGERTWRFSVGGYVGFRLNSYRKTVAEGGNYNQKEYASTYVYDSYRPKFNSIRYGLSASVGYRNINLFVQRDFQNRNAFTERKDQIGSLHPLSFGVTLLTN